MSGHSKWSTIKHKKAATDAKRGKLFTRVAKEITIAAREGGGDPDTNNRLRLAISKAKAANMPKDNIERAIKRGTGEIEGMELVEVMYEGYAPNGVGLLIETVTDNRNRAVADIRHTLTKFGGSMGETGSVAWQFSRKGYIALAGNGEIDEDELFLVAADAGAEDIQFGDPVEIFSPLESFQAVQEAVEEAGHPISEANLLYDPDNPISLEQAQTVQAMKAIEALEDLDNVQNVYSTLDITDEAIAALEGA